MNRKVIHSENPEKTLWWKLNGYKNIDKVSAEIAPLHKKPENAKKQAKQIKNCIEQAEEYFQAASMVSLATQPLLLYYGMASLSWALILYKSTGDFALDRLDPNHLEHGLTRPLLNYSLHKKSLVELLTEISTKVPPLAGSHLRGTFGLLAQNSRIEPFSSTWTKQDGRIVTSKNILHPAESGMNITDIAGRAFSLKDFFFQIPDLGVFLSELGIRPSFAVITHFESTHLSDNSTRIDLATARCTEEEITQLEASFKGYPGWTINRVPTGIHAQLHAKEEEGATGPILSETVQGSRYIYLKNDDPLPEPARFLGAMFLLGILVRYFPHLWMHLIESSHPLVNAVEAFMPIAKRSYPNLILNNLTGDSFHFSQAT